jgi:hypothetical protein
MHSIVFISIGQKKIKSVIAPASLRIKLSLSLSLSLSSFLRVSLSFSVLFYHQSFVFCSVVLNF